MLRIAMMATAAMMTPAALAAEKATFTVHDVTLTAQLPAGYCLPKHKDRLVADMIASADDQNVTLATFIRCDMQGRSDGFGNDYMLIKAPKSDLASRAARPELLTVLEAEFGKAEWQADGAGMKEATAGASQSLSNAFETDIDLQGAIAPRGVDDDCAYLGGTFQISGGGTSYPIIAGACITSAAEKILVVYSYDDPDKGGGIAGKMRTAHDVAMSIARLP